MMIAHATGLVTIPDALASVEAAPLLCAGIATFNALRKSGAGAGDLVAIQGIGGLGHLALQYARRMGFKVIAIGRGADIAAAGAATRSSSLHRHSGIRQAMAVPRGHDVAAAYVRDFVERKKTEGFIRAALDESGQADATAAPSV
jgi:alcohol dehydrogenase